jgi:hypothetical protein
LSNNDPEFHVYVLEFRWYGVLLIGLATFQAPIFPQLLSYLYFITVPGSI